MFRRNEDAESAKTRKGWKLREKKSCGTGGGKGTSTRRYVSLKEREVFRPAGGRP